LIEHLGIGGFEALKGQLQTYANERRWIVDFVTDARCHLTDDGKFF